MTAQPVSAVWCWKYSKTPFKAIYGRVTGSTSYSKDFLQASGDCAETLEKLVCGGDTEERTAIRVVWPGGEREDCFIQRSAADYAQTGRLQLKWPTSDAPDPWRLTPQPGPGTVETFPGTPGLLSSDATADAQWDQLDQRQLEPWLIAVQLAGRPDTLHVRAYLGAPTPELEHASTALLPEQVLQVLAGTTSGCGFVESDSVRPVRAQAIVTRILEALKTGPNVLLVGPPGTGKTVALEDLRNLYSTGGGGMLFDPEILHDAWSEAPTTPTGPVRSVVFHPSYTYEDLVLGLLPEPTEIGVGIRVSPGPLLSLANYAAQSGNSALLVVDEFNRGNAAAIFGDALALLDADKRSDLARGVEGAHIDRPYQHLDVRLPPELSENKIDGDRLGDQVTLPRSLSIVAALNSSDRSVAPLDAALRRRFSIIQVDPDYDVLAAHFGVELGAPTADVADWEVVDVLKLAVMMLQGLNRRIELISGADFLLGHSHLWHVGGGNRNEAAIALAKAFDERIVGTLRLSFADYDEGLAAVLNAGTSDDTSSHADAVAGWVLPPPGMEHVAAPRLRTHLVQERPGDEILRALLTLT